MPNHKGTQILHTPRLTLRPFTTEDAQAMYENWASDEHVTRYLTWTPHPSPDFTRQLVAHWCDSYQRPDFYQWVIVYEEASVGSISIVSSSDKHEYAELGYCMARAWWNQGLMTEAVTAVIDYLFAQCSFHRLQLCHAAPNPASGAVARKCGFLCEGTLRGYHKGHDGQFLDIVQYGLLRQDWEAHGKAAEK